MNHGVYIATKNREKDVFKFLDSLILNQSQYEVVLIDSTEPPERFATFDYSLRLRYPLLKFTHIFHNGRLPSARNAGLNLNLNHDLIHFFDDDVTIPGNYLLKIEEFLADHPDVFGGGPRILGSYVPDLKRNTSHFLDLIRRIRNLRLRFRKYGSVNRGCKHHWVPDQVGSSMKVEWIPGCAMFFKPEVFQLFRFNSKMETGFRSYAFGEDMEFTFRVSQKFELMSVDTTVIEHHLAPSPRSDMIFISSCLGATMAHMLLMFPKKFSKRRIFLEKIPEFFLQALNLPSNRISTFFKSLILFRREFRREFREKNWLEL